MGDIFYIYFNFYVGHYYWWLQHLIFPSCSATFISITINHISLLENMKGCNLNFPKRFSRKKNNPRHYITISMYTQISPCQLVDIFNISNQISYKHQEESLIKLKTAHHDRVSSESPGLMFSTFLQPLLNLLVVQIRSTRSLSNVNISLVLPCSGSELSGTRMIVKSSTPWEA